MPVTITISNSADHQVELELHCPAEDASSPAARVGIAVCQLIYSHLQPPTEPPPSPHRH